MGFHCFSFSSSFLSYLQTPCSYLHKNEILWISWYIRPLKVPLKEPDCCFQGLFFSRNFSVQSVIVINCMKLSGCIELVATSRECGPNSRSQICCPGNIFWTAARNLMYASYINSILWTAMCEIVIMSNHSFCIHKNWLANLHLSDKVWDIATLSNYQNWKSKFDV